MKIDESNKAPRIDQLIAKYKGNKFQNRIKDVQTVIVHQNLSPRGLNGETNPNFFMFGASPRAAKESKLKFLKGQGKIT